ncbi:MAG: superinfection immunity protein [Candidatus Marinimicrobia bacterium]|nr:superinfection immunity protein [Candidatus Neomarinimicrobiota bacterium]
MFIGLLLAALIIYFAPAYLAYSKKKRNAGAILALNIFLGWTLLGWVIALVWALTVDTERG